MGDTDINRTGIGPGHRLLKRHTWLASIPAAGDGDPDLAALRAAHDPPAGHRGAPRADDRGPDDRPAT